VLGREPMPETYSPTARSDSFKTLGARFAWGIADQALSSLTNFALGLLAARSLGPSEFGAFGIAFAIYVVLLGTSRTISGDPMVIRFSSTASELWRRAAGCATGSAISVGIVAGAACLLLAQSVHGTLSSTLVALGLILPGVLLQDAWRFAFFARGSGSAAFFNDLLWAILLFPSLTVLLMQHGASPASLLLVWGGAGTIAGLVGGIQASVLPKPERIFSWFREHSDLIPRYVAEFAVTTGTSQIIVFLVGALAGLSEVGAIRGGQLLFGPLNILILSAGLVAIPEGVRFLRKSEASLRRFCMVYASLLGGSALGMGIVAWTLPPSIGAAILGKNWGPAHGVIIPLMLSTFGSAVTMGAGVGLRALAASRLSLRARLFVAPITLAAGSVGAALRGARGAAWGLAVALLLGAVIWWHHFSTGLQQNEGAQREAEMEVVRDSPFSP
jgi:O-antigen/teichoic acid export membrane protein